MMLQTGTHFLPGPISFMLDNALIGHSKTSKIFSIYDLEELYREFCFDTSEERLENGWINIKCNIGSDRQIAEPLVQFQTESINDFGFIGHYFFLSKQHIDEKTTVFRKIEDMQNNVNSKSSRSKQASEFLKGYIVGGNEVIFMCDADGISCCEIENPKTTSGKNELYYTTVWSHRVMPENKHLTIDGRKVTIETRGGITISDNHLLYCGNYYELDDEVQSDNDVKVFIRPFFLVRILDIKSGKLLKSIPIENTTVEARPSYVDMVLENGEICITIIKHGCSSHTFINLAMIDEDMEEEDVELNNQTIEYRSEQLSNRKRRLIRQGRLPEGEPTVLRIPDIA